MARKMKASRRAGRKKEYGIFGEKIFTVEEEHSLLLFTAGVCFGIGLVALTVKEYLFAAVSLFSLLLVLLFIDKRVREHGRGK